MKGFKKANIYIEGEGIVKTNLAIDNGKITAIGKNIAVDDPFEIDENDVVVAGFVDEHIHGAMGADAMDGNVEALKTIANAIASEGTTSFLATTMTQSPQKITDALLAVNRYIGSHSAFGARLLGVHLEGPFISLKHVGAQPIEYVAKPDVEVFEGYQKASGGNIKIVSLAPEIEGAKALIEHLKDNKIVASVGHSDAKISDIESAMKSGLSSVTHTYNAQTPIHHREVGVVGSAMLFDDLNCEIICDTIHVSVPAIKLLLKNKPHDKITLITDAMRAKHMPDGKSELGGQVVIVKNGEARLENGTLAGSVLKMNNAVKNLVEKCGVKFEDAIDFATINPAKNLGLENEIGSIKAGKNADFAVLNKDFEVSLTVRDGIAVFKK